jgi:hypothetical protein
MLFRFDCSFAKLVTLISLTLGMCPAVLAEVPEQFREIRKSIEDRLPKEKVPSIAVAVAKNGNILGEDAIGWADI